MAEKVTIYVEDKNIEAEQGENLLKVAREAGIEIPGLCYHPKLTPTGSCRLCVVKVNGNPEPVPACNINVSQGLEVIAFDEDLEAWRQRVVDLLFSEHDCSCINCNAAGNCELQDLAYKYGLIGLNGKRFKKVYKDTASKVERFPLADAISEDEEIDSLYSKKNSYNGNPEDCIRCGFCVEACSMDLYPVLMMEAQVEDDQKAMKNLHPDDCITCGLCSYVCPAKIRLPKYFNPVKKKKQKK